MFLNNKYLNWYWSIISTAKQRINCQSDYFEVHHVVPRCLGGTDAKENLVKLTAREHFVCHRLLTKITKGKARRSMCFAMWAITKMRHNRLQPININSHTFNIIRREYSKTLSEQKRGIPRSQETKDKISLSHIGKILSKQHKDAISKGGLGRVVSEETRQKISVIHSGKTVSVEARKNIGAASIGRKEQSKTWKIKDPMGNVFDTDRLKDFCLERGLSLIAIRRSYEKLPVSKGKSKGWHAVYRDR